MAEIRIYHNGECSKSKGALEILLERQIPHEVRWYLAEPLSREELQSLLSKLGMKPYELVRKGEPLYLQEYQGKTLADDEWLDVLVSHPVLIERPIVERGDHAIVARPPERVFEII